MESNEYQLVLQFPGDSIHDYDWMIKLEDALIELLDEEAEIDGHDAGSGTMNIFILTDDPNRTFLKASALLEPHEAVMKVAYRDIDSDDWTILHPAGLTTFNVL